MFRFLTASAQPDDREHHSLDPASVNYGHYMTLADADLRLFSVYDALRYDRADADMLSPSASGFVKFPVRC